MELWAQSSGGSGCNESEERTPALDTHRWGGGEFPWPSSKAWSALQTSRLGLAPGEARAQESYWRKRVCPIHRVLKYSGQSYHKTQGAVAGAPCPSPK